MGESRLCSLTSCSQVLTIAARRFEQQLVSLRTALEGDARIHRSDQNAWTSSGLHASTTEDV